MNIIDRHAAARLNALASLCALILTLSADLDRSRGTNRRDAESYSASSADRLSDRLSLDYPLLA